MVDPILGCCDKQDCLKHSTSVDIVVKKRLKPQLPHTVVEGGRKLQLIDASLL